MARLTVTIALIAIAVAITAFTPLLTPMMSVEAQSEVHSIRQVPVVTKDVVFDPNSQKFYASVPSRAGASGNSIARIDPVSGQVEGFVFIGSEPGKLALSDDGEALYVSLDGAAAIRRYDVDTQTASTQFALGEEVFDGPLFAKDLAVAPGNPNLVAVSRKVLTSSPDFEGVAVYENGVRRPRATPGHTGSDFIAFSASASTLYGLSSGGGGIQKLSVNASGVTVASSTPSSSSGQDFEFDAGFLYLPSGQVVNADTLLVAGTFTLTDGPVALEVDSSVGRVYFLTATDNVFSDTDPRTLTLRAFDKNTFLPVGSLTFPNVRGRVTSLVRWGANGLAFGSTGGQFYLIQTTLVPSNEPVPSPTPTPSPTVSPTPTPTPTPGPGQLREVSIVAKDLVIDPSGVIFATVPSSVGAGGNSITPIDPVTNTVGQPVLVGSEPNRLAISDNGQVIYVGLDGAKAVRRFDVATRTPGLQFPLDPQGQHVAVDIAVAPGQPQTIAAVRGEHPNASNGGVAVYDDGVQRPITTGFGHNINVIEFSASPMLLYGHNNFSSEAGFRKMAAPSCGVSVMSMKASLLSGANFKIENGRAFGTSGRVADPEAGTLLGTYAATADVPLGNFPTAVIADSSANRVYFFMNTSSSDFFPNTLFVRAFDMQTFIHVGTLAIPNISGRPTSVVRWGTDGFAFRTTTDKVYLIQTSLIPAQSQPPLPAPQPTPPTYTLRGQVGTSPNIQLPPVTLQLSGGASGTTTTNPDGSFAFTGLPFCTTFTVTPLPVENFTLGPSSRTITPADQNNPNLATAFFSAVPKLITFNSLGMSATEGSTVNVSVTRQGDISSAATVNYQTSDGTASERSDYNAAVGTLRFDPNQSTKQITIFLTDDVRSEGSETLTLSLSSPTGALLDPQSSLPITITDNDPINGTTNPADEATFFVRQHYRDFLNRDPDPSGLAFWVNEITSCGSDPQCVEIKRINVSAAFFLSIEFQETGYFAYRTFKAAHGDATSPNVGGTVPVIRFKEFLGDAQRLGDGVQVGIGDWQAKLDSNKSAYMLEFVQRQRFLDEFPLTMTADEFVSKLDQNAGGVLSLFEKSQLVALLSPTPQNAASRASVVRAVTDDTDLKAGEFNRAFVLMQYYGYLRRNPNDPQDVDFAGWKFWLDKLNSFNGNFIDAEMVKAFISSIEYRGRFGP